MLVVFGTRPEAIKLCPLIAALRNTVPRLHTVVCVTGQHREMLQQVLAAFGITPDFDLQAMRPGQTLNALSGRLMSGLEPVFQSVQPSLTVVQGDTTTTLCGALASFQAGVPVAHVEAGLRTGDLQAPFPEEANRVLTDHLSQLHFPATEWAAGNLLREGFRSENVLVTGNTGIDAVLSVCRGLQEGRLQPAPLQLQAGKRLILVTAHRRESVGAGLAEIAAAVSQIATREDVQIVWPVHPNPAVKGFVENAIGNKPNVLLVEPLDYVSFVDLMRRAYIILTDSGGVQEEAPSLGKPVLVLREKTERPEAIDAGSVKLTGLHRASIVRTTNQLLDDPADYNRMAQHRNAYGDGTACIRIAARIRSYLFPELGVEAAGDAQP